jgi:ethanolaminephosphotransferase
MDAVDGKQARRTGSSSPLGQLFDHGCDALGTMPLALAICSCMGFGRTIWSVIFIATIQVPFYTAQYEEHFVHTLRTQVANFGVTEGQYLEAGLMLATAIFGPHIWDTEIPYTEPLGKGLLPGPNGQENHARITFRTAALYAGCFFPILLGTTAVFTVFFKGHYLAFLRLIPLVAMESLLAWVSMADPKRSGLAHAFHLHPVPFLMTFGIALTHMANRIIIATVCKIPFPMVEWPILLPIPIILATDEAFAHQRGAQLYLLVAYALLVLFVYLHFAVNVGHQIAKHLKINILTLGKRKQ